MTSFGYRENVLGTTFFRAFSGCKNMTKKSFVITYSYLLVIDSAILILFYYMGKIFSKNLMIRNMFTITTEIIYVENNPRKSRFATALQIMERPGQRSDPSY